MDKRNQEYLITIHGSSIRQYPEPFRNFMRWFVDTKEDEPLDQALETWGARVVDHTDYESPIIFAFKTENHYNEFVSKFSKLNSN